ncbi:hypothetical protein AAMO2058_000693500 [Amorphochlora amoebiformis]
MDPEGQVVKLREKGISRLKASTHLNEFIKKQQRNRVRDRKDNFPGATGVSDDIFSQLQLLRNAVDASIRVV